MIKLLLAQLSQHVDKLRVEVASPLSAAFYKSLDVERLAGDIIENKVRVSYRIVFIRNFSSPKAADTG